MIMIISCCLTYGIAEESTEADEEIMFTTVSETEVTKIKEKYNLNSYEGKINCITEVLNYIGVRNKEKYIKIFNDELIEKFLNAEKYGYRESTETFIAKESSPNSINRSVETSGRDYENLTLGILWAKAGNEYAILGCCQWHDLPIMRIDDIISLDLGGGSIQAGSQMGALYYEKNGVEYEELYYNYSTNYRGTGTACVFEVNLPNSADTISVITSYNIINSNNENTITLQYFHKFLPLNVSISAAYIVGISVSPYSCVTEYNLQCGTA